MIRIEVEDYCHACMDFSPDVTKPTKYQAYDGEIFMSDTIVRCEHRRRCEALKKYIVRQMSETEEAVG